MKLLKLFATLGIVVLTYIFAVPVSAQIYLSIDTVTVQNARIPLPLRETGRNISVIQESMIRQMSYTSLDDLLQFVPGIEVQSRNAFGAQGDITMRGSTFNQVLVMVDGMKLNDPLTAHFNNYLPVAPTEIERIEVLRGAAAAMYGADAVGGVINIVTKGFAGKSEPGSRFSGRFNFGQNRLVNAQQGFSTRQGRLYLGGGFSLNQSDGQLVKEKILDNTTLESFRNYFDIKTMGLTIAYDLSDQWKLSARAAYDYRDFSARYFYTVSPLDKSTETTRNWWNQVQLRQTGNRASTDINLAYKYNTDEFIFSPDFASTNNHLTQFWNFTANQLRTLTAGLSLQYGLQIDHRSIESNDRGNHDDWHAGVYAMGVLQPGSHWNLTASLRLDYDENYDLELSPQLNVSYVLDRVTFRGAAGRSIRAANYTERFVSFNLPNLTPGRNLGNPDLAAESSWSEEIGVDLELSPGWQLKATGFLRQSSSLIDYVLTNESEIPYNQNLQTGADYFYARNVSEVRNAGVEIESWFRKQFSPGAGINASLGYTYLRTTNAEGIVSNYIASHARHLITTNIVLVTGSLEFNLNGLFKERDERLAAAIGSRLTPTYTVWNTRLGWNLTDQLGLNVQVHNLFDADYADILGAPMPRRWLMAGVQFDL